MVSAIYGRRRYWFITTNFSEALTVSMKEHVMCPITACIEMTFYHVNDYFMFWRKAVTMRLPEVTFYLNQICKISRI